MITRDGERCSRNYIVVLYHPSITISEIKYIGKETNLLDEREAGLELPADGHLIIEPDLWESVILQQLKNIPNHEIADKTGLSRRQIIRLKQGKHHPRQETVKKLKKFGLNF